MVEYVVCVSMQLSIVENSCICLDKGTYVCMLLKKLIMDLKSWIQMHIMIENVCINSDMIENTFLWCKLHTALCSFVDCYIILHWTVGHNCILVHIVTYCYILFQNALYGWTWLIKVLYCCRWLHMCKRSHIVANWCK